MLKINLKIAFSFLFAITPFYGYEVKAQNPRICEQDLAREINAILDNPIHQRATWGVLVQHLNSDNILYQLNDEKYFIPASNAKVLTTASALLKFGADHQISTPIHYTGEMPNIDTLTIIGQGDPTITSEKLDEIAQSLRDRGITGINQLIIQDNAPFSDIINGTWENSDLPYYYAPPVGNIILNQNTVTMSFLGQRVNQPATIQWSDNMAGRQWRVINNVITTDNPDDNNIRLIPNWRESTLEVTGELGVNQESRQWWLSIPNPHQYFLDSLQVALRNQNISVSSTRIVNANIVDHLTSENQLMEIKSELFSEIVNTTNKDSNNLFAEILLRQLRSENVSQFEEQKAVLSTINVDPQAYNLRDGSGLSRQNLITPSAMVAVLQGISNTEHGKMFRQSLPMAGVDGTLRNRFQDSISQGNFVAKTGTLTGVTALSGYLEVENYPDLVVSIMVNKSMESGVTLRETTDQIVDTVARVRVCE
ncbi:D-alanyl-D-alaninecarboxypeptidase/D-alanyl-D-al anine-endopeptidase [Cyanobacterium stanieri PCC 7202]|uniref:D-alanyl-D-alaninecarboxypeptidase/D-alanyl-D-al anine-endopeptidase n=1 Tax=Cyanobacterium stanieri (strain ATCC 29140 / PCC 7202) TaxID=292563 RepID=K9YHQ5_CYASC|nr:D-alanyl-D-alaninecarboxypeptidase/D-alanyl-D-al anine-endopeptidase [Cyanobacterium stanieri PCC 7202]